MEQSVIDPELEPFQPDTSGMPVNWAPDATKAVEPFSTEAVILQPPLQGAPNDAPLLSPAQVIPLPAAPKFTWDEVAKHEGFKQLPPEEKVKALTDYATETQNYLSSLPDTRPDHVRKEISVFMADNWKEIAGDAPQPGIFKHFVGGVNENLNKAAKGIVQAMPETAHTSGERAAGIQAEMTFARGPRPEMPKTDPNDFGPHDDIIAAQSAWDSYQRNPHKIAELERESNQIKAGIHPKFSDKSRDEMIMRGRKAKQDIVEYLQDNIDWTNGQLKITPESRRTVPGEIGAGIAGVADMLWGPGMPVALAARAFSEGHDESVAKSQAAGITDPAKIDEIARRDGLEGAIKLAPVLIAYSLTGKVGGKVAEKLLGKEAGLLKKVLVGGTTAAVANVATSTGMRVLEGEPVFGTMGGTLTDVGFGFGGAALHLQAQRAQLKKALKADESAAQEGMKEAVPSGLISETRLRKFGQAHLDHLDEVAAQRKLQPHEEARRAMLFKVLSSDGAPTELADYYGMKVKPKITMLAPESPEVAAVKAETSAQAEKLRATGSPETAAEIEARGEQTALVTEAATPTAKVNELLKDHNAAIDAIEQSDMSRGDKDAALDALGKAPEAPVAEAPVKTKLQIAQAEYDNAVKLEDNDLVAVKFSALQDAKAERAKEQSDALALVASTADALKNADRKQPEDYAAKLDAHERALAAAASTRAGAPRPKAAKPVDARPMSERIAEAQRMPSGPEKDAALKSIAEELTGQQTAARGEAQTSNPELTAMGEKNGARYEGPNADGTHSLTLLDKGKETTFTMPKEFTEADLQAKIAAKRAEFAPAEPAARLNVGHDSKEGGKNAVAFERIKKALPPDVTVTKHTIVEDSGENKSVVDLSRALTKEELRALADATDQDAIPQNTPKGGTMEGRDIASYGGAFNGEYFVDHEGKPLVESKPVATAPTPEDTAPARLGIDKGERPIAEALAEVRDRTDDPFLKKLYGNLVKLFGNDDQGVVKASDSTPADGGVEHTGVYSWKKQEILVNKKGDPNEADFVMGHESVHHGTAHQIIHDMEFRGEITEIAELVRNRKGADQHAYELFGILAGDEVPTNAKINPHEFVAGMVKPEFRDFLKSEGMWTRVVNAVMRTFGIERSAFKRMDDLLNGLDPNARRVAIEATTAAPGSIGSGKFVKPSAKEIKEQDKQRISQRVPTNIGAKENALTGNLKTGLESVNSNPKFAAKLANAVKGYGGFKTKNTEPAKVLNDFVDHAKSNLLWLYDNTLPEIRDRARHWYVGANKIAGELGKKFGVKRETASAVIASLSPQNPWHNNVSLAERVMDVYKNKRAQVWSDTMTKTAKSLPFANKEFLRAVKKIAGKKFGDLTDLYERAVFIRVFDETHNPREFKVITPEGGRAGFMRNDKGDLTASNWFSFNPIQKALSVLDNPARENVSLQMGFAHKVRSFYNSIVAPHSTEGDYVSDTHNVAASLLEPIGGKDKKVVQSFGGIKNGETGDKGTYALYAEAGRRAAAERGVLPREMQSVTWEAVRSLFSPEFKTDENLDIVHRLWQGYKSGKLSIDEVRNQISTGAGGFAKPEWSDGRDAGLHGNEQTAPNKGDVSPIEPVEGATGRGAGSRVARAVPEENLGAPLSAYQARLRRERFARLKARNEAAANWNPFKGIPTELRGVPKEVAAEVEALPVPIKKQQLTHAEQDVRDTAYMADLRDVAADTTLNIQERAAELRRVHVAAFPEMKPMYETLGYSTEGKTAADKIAGDRADISQPAQRTLNLGSGKKADSTAEEKHGILFPNEAANSTTIAASHSNAGENTQDAARFISRFVRERDPTLQRTENVGERTASGTRPTQSEAAKSLQEEGLTEWAAQTGRLLTLPQFGKMVGEHGYKNMGALAAADPKLFAEVAKTYRADHVLGAGKVVKPEGLTEAKIDALPISDAIKARMKAAIKPANAAPIGPATLPGSPAATLTGTKMATVAAERAARDLAPVTETASREFGEAWTAGQEKVKADPKAGARLVAELNAEGRALNDIDNAVLLSHQIEVQREHDAAIRALNETPKDVDAQRRLDDARAASMAAYDAADAAGTETGRGLNARKMLIANDFSIARMENTYRAMVNEGRPLSEEQAGEIAGMHNRIEKAEKALTAYELRKAVPVERVTKMSDSQLGHLSVGKLSATRAVIEAQIEALQKSETLGAGKTIEELPENPTERLAVLIAQRGRVIAIEKAKEARLLEGDKRRIRTNIADLTAKTETKDFAPAEKRAPRMDDEKAGLMLEYQKAKEAYHTALIEGKLANQTTGEKGLRIAGEVSSFARAAKTSLDVSAVLRQGGFIAMAHPVRAAKNLGDMFRAFASETEHLKIKQDIVNRENAANYKQSGLFLSEESSTQLSKMEEVYMSRWVKKLPKKFGGELLRGSERAYTAFLDLLRADSFDAMVAGLARDGKATPAEMKAIANYINVATGRGDMGKLTGASVAMNKVFFAPRYVASRFQLLTGQPLRKGLLGKESSSRARKQIAIEYARALGGLTVVFGLGIAAGGTVETDPRESDFGKIRFGDTRLDPLFGLSQTTVFLSRLATHKQGKKDIDTGKFGSTSSSDLLLRFGRSKLAPIPSSILNAWEGKDVTGQKTTALWEAGQLPLPLAITDVYKAMRDQDIPHGTAIAMLTLFGMSAQTYSPRVSEKKSKSSNSRVTNRDVNR